MSHVVNKAKANAAKQRAAEIRAAQEAAERRRRIIMASVVIAVVLAIIGAIIAGSLLSGGSSQTQKNAGGALDTASVDALTKVPASTINAIGKGNSGAPSRIKDGTAQLVDGKPQVLYVGAEYCPYCAGLRWSVAEALSRFGTWGPLNESYSSADDQPANIPTITFSGAKLTSDTVSFAGYETATNVFKNGTYAKKDTLPDAANELVRKYNFPPYVSGQGGAIPFLLINGKVMQNGALFDTTLLSGKKPTEVAAALKNPDDEITKAVVASANVLTAAICEQTGNKPAATCDAKGVKDAASAITKTVG